VSIVEQTSALTIRFRTWLIGLPRFPKRVILGSIDFFYLSLALWALLSLRYAEFYLPPSLAVGLVLAAAPIISVSTFAWFGLYRLVTRYAGHNGTTKIAICMALSVLIWALVVLMSGVTSVPRSVVVLYTLLGSIFVYLVRQAAAWILHVAGIPMPIPSAARHRPSIVIFGASQAGAQLAEALHQSGDARVIGFIDTTPSLWGQYLGKLKIYRPEKLPRLIEHEHISEVILAMPEAMRNKRQTVVKWLQDFPVNVKIIPAIEDLASGRVTINDLRLVDVEDLLGRNPVPPAIELLAQNIAAKSVMITGAGGSIGSELTRQIFRQKPARLVLFERSETALYEIDLEIRAIATQLPIEHRPEIITVLGSVLDENYVLGVLTYHKVTTVYHAAAYKHVPIVEDNPMAGLRNNTFGTQALANASRKAGVNRMVLISTDKAVRPTNIMGATKRLAELVLQAHALDPRCKTVFSIVRFGNVLDSSGSVVRLFRRQIKAGGPVTVTHPDIIRYFMSIPEAAELVIQAGAMAAGGEVFVLDMGEPVKIADLARLMIRLMGREVKDETKPDGDIEIEFSGLRPGEKLYEELTIGDNATSTQHARIMRNNEPFLQQAILVDELSRLRFAAAHNDVNAIRAIICRLVEGYIPRDETFDEDRWSTALSPATGTLH